jgi:hypothetical protein
MSLTLLYLVMPDHATTRITLACSLSSPYTHRIQPARMPATHHPISPSNALRRREPYPTLPYPTPPHALSHALVDLLRPPRPIDSPSRLRVVVLPFLGLIPR